MAALLFRLSVPIEAAWAGIIGDGTPMRRAVEVDVEQVERRGARRRPGPWWTQ